MSDKNPYDLQRALNEQPKITFPAWRKALAPTAEPALMTDQAKIDALGEKMGLPETIPTPFDAWAKALKTSQSSKEELGKTPAELIPQAARYLGEAANQVAMGVPEMAARAVGEGPAIDTYREANPALTDSARIGGQIAGMAPTPSGSVIAAAGPIAGKIKPTWTTLKEIATLKEKINPAHYDNYEGLGIRVIPLGDKVKVGQKLKNSNRWEDGNWTNEELPGVSTIDARANIRPGSDMGAYSGNRVVVVGSKERGMGGEDLHESILSDPIVLQILQ